MNLATLVNLSLVLVSQLNLHLANLLVRTSQLSLAQMNLLTLTKVTQLP